MNTKFSYMYRDAANYKTFYEWVFEGELSQKQMQDFGFVCQDKYFIPRALALPGGVFEEDEGYDINYDHYWCEHDFEDSFTLTDEKPNNFTLNGVTTTISIKEFLELFVRCNKNWESALANSINIFDLRAEAATNKFFEQNNEANEFIEYLKENRNYWLKVPHLDSKKIAKGVLFSVLVLLDGDSGTNDFHSYSIKDTVTGEKLTCGYLHELLSDNAVEKKRFITDLKEILGYWLDVSDISSEDIVDGILYSILTYFDGYSGINGFHSCEIIDEYNGKRIDCGFMRDLYLDREINTPEQATENTSLKASLDSKIVNAEHIKNDSSDVHIKNDKKLSLVR